MSQACKKKKQPIKISTNDPKILEVQSHNNVNEITVVYFKIVRYSLLILSSSFLTFWIPQFILSVKAIDWKLEYDPNFDVYYIDSLFYGIWYQGLFPHESNYFGIFMVWITVIHILILYFAYKTEKFYTRMFQKKQLIQHLTLEFTHIPLSMNQESSVENFFNELSMKSVEEVSLVYDMSDLYKTEIELRSVSDSLKQLNKDGKSGTRQYKEFCWKRNGLIEEQVDNCTAIKSNPKKYFKGKGFVTFKTYKGALVVIDTWKKALKSLKEQSRDKSANPIANDNTGDNKALPKKNKLQGIVNRNIIDRTIPEDTASDMLSKQKAPTQSKKSFLTQFLLRAKVNPQDEKRVEYLLECVDPNFKIKRAQRVEDIHWNFEEKKKPAKWSQLFFIVSLFTFIPFLTYPPSVWAAKCSGETTLGIDTSLYPVLISNALIGLCVVIDMIAYSLIEKFYTEDRFYKASTLVFYKFISQNIYKISSNLYYQLFGWVVGYDEMQTDSDTEDTKLKMAKGLIATTYMTITFVVIGQLITQGFVPILLHKLAKLKEPRLHNITFGLSTILIQIFHLGFYTPFQPNSIFTVVLYMGVLYKMESYMFRNGIIICDKISSTATLSTFWIICYIGFFPLTLGSFQMLKDNKMGIKSIPIGTGFPYNTFYLYIMIAVWLVTLFMFYNYYKACKFIARVQANIWKLHENQAQLKTTGLSYRKLNPYYKVNYVIENIGGVKDQPQMNCPVIFHHDNEINVKDMFIPNKSVLTELLSKTKQPAIIFSEPHREENPLLATPINPTTKPEISPERELFFPYPYPQKQDPLTPERKSYEKFISPSPGKRSNAKTHLTDYMKNRDLMASSCALLSGNKSSFELLYSGGDLPDYYGQDDTPQKIDTDNLFQPYEKIETEEYNG